MKKSSFRAKLKRGEISFISLLVITPLCFLWMQSQPELLQSNLESVQQNLAEMTQSK